MKTKLFFASSLVLATVLYSSTSIARPPFDWKNLEVDRCELFDLGPDEDLVLKVTCFSKISGIRDCSRAGGEVGLIGSRLVCRAVQFVPVAAAAAAPGAVSGSAAIRRPLPVLPPPFFPDDLSAAQFKPLPIPAALYNGQQDPRAFKD